MPPCSLVYTRVVKFIVLGSSILVLVLAMVGESSETYEKKLRLRIGAKLTWFIGHI